MAIPAGINVNTSYCLNIIRTSIHLKLNIIYRVEFILLPTAILSLVLNHEFSVMEILWTFSIYLESLAILPQLFMVTKTGEAESITSHYLFALGMYRALYILNWVYRYYFEGTYLTARGSPVSCNIWNKVWCSLYNKWVAKFFSLQNDKLPNLAYFKYFLITQQFSLLWVLAFWLA